jgi:hypothetical protein
MCDGDLRAWIEQEAIHLRAAASHGDPVELSVDEVRVLAKELLRLADRISD